MKYKLLKRIVILASFGLLNNAAMAADEFALTIKNHQFSPEEIVIPANQKVKIKVQNLDDTAEEFESYDLDREKIVAANSSVVIFIGPLTPGVYSFFGEFNPDTAKGRIKAQ